MQDGCNKIQLFVFSAYILMTADPGTSDNGGDARMASSTHGSVSLSGGNGREPVKSIVNQLKENNFPMVCTALSCFNHLEPNNM